MTAEAEPVPPTTIEPPGNRESASWRWLIRSGMIVGVLGWLWPIGVGGMNPVGGDATQFSMGLMAFLRESLIKYRWPLWNDLWGFGFPGLAESQMGVYYPPHWGYAFVSTETAYSASLVAHFVWGALGAAWMARRFGVSEMGSALGGFAWATSGFFLIHLPHQWAYTVGSWMPWAWGLAWRTVRFPEAPERSALILAAVLAIQILPGHFQMAFITEVGVLALAVAGEGRGRFRGKVYVLQALAAMIPLAAAQLLPTLALAQLSGQDRGFEYLSGFAAGPVHLVSYVAPGLFHRSPLWRPVAWDLFHMAPEEYLGYLGLVPLFLAARAIAGRGWSNPNVRALTLVAALTLILSLGPYFPGFRALIAVPGFSFFRAPARWSLGTALALACLAGHGFDAILRGKGWGRRSVLGFFAASTLAVGLIVGGFELALAATRGSGWPEVASVFERGLQTLPWAGKPDSPTFRSAMLAAYRPQADLRVQAAQARLDGRPFPPSGLILSRERWGIYTRELGGSAVVLVGFAVVGLTLGRRPRGLAWGLGILTVLDLIGHGQARPFDLGPIRPLVEQSPVLARVAREGRGLRTLDPAQNLFLVAGADSAIAYRTLNLPWPRTWQTIARGLESDDPQVPEALRALGIGARVLDPFEARSVPPGWLAGGWGATSDSIRDPALAGWLFGADFARLNRLEEFRWIKSAKPPTRAWRTVELSWSPMIFASTNLQGAEPLVWRSPRPERVEVEWLASPNDKPGWVLISQTFDPEWAGIWVGPTGETRPAMVIPAFEGFQAVAAPPLKPGRWTLHLEYRGNAARWGLLVSVVAWLVWVGVAVWVWFRGRSLGREVSPSRSLAAEADR